MVNNFSKFDLIKFFFINLLLGIRPLSARYTDRLQSYQQPSFVIPEPSLSLPPSSARRINFIDSNSRYFKTPHSASWHYNRFAPETYY